MDLMKYFENDVPSCFYHYSLFDGESPLEIYPMYDCTYKNYFSCYRMGEDVFLDIRSYKISERQRNSKQFRSYLEKVLLDYSWFQAISEYRNYELPKEFSFSIQDLRIQKDGMKKIDIRDNDKNCFIIHFHKITPKKYNQLAIKGKKNMTVYLRKYFSSSRIIIKMSKKEQQ